MSSQIGNTIRVSVFGESHGPAIGMTMDNPPVGIVLDAAYIAAQMARRAPGNDPTATPRKEADMPEFLSGVQNGVTTGAPLTAVIRNQNTRSGDYAALKNRPRPSHADYAAGIRYCGFADLTGGGHFSGRLTAPLVLAGAVLRLYLRQHGIEIGGHITQIGTATDRRFDPVHISGQMLEQLAEQPFPVLESGVQAAMRDEILRAAQEKDSIGGRVELAVCGLPAGLGSPMFDGVENRIAQAVFGVPAVKGIAFGAGFDFASMRGSTANDAMRYENNQVICTTNHCGGITGGITNAMPVVFEVALKPTPSIALPQKTVDLAARENAELTVQGRHDPCIVPRALPALEAVTAIAVANLLPEVGVQ